MTNTEHNAMTSAENMTAYGLVLHGLTNPPEGGFTANEADHMISTAVRKAIIAACDIAGSQIPQVSTQHIQALDAVRETALKAWATGETQPTRAASIPGR